MRERPILFSASMVRALLEGRKTQTRRIMKRQPAYPESWESSRFVLEDGGINAYYPWFPAPWKRLHCPYGFPGDRLWVKETWTGAWYEGVNDMHLSFAADGGEGCVAAPAFYTLPKAAAKPQGWVSPLFMPRWASRITLEITDVRVQRLQDISEEDTIAEGCERCKVTEQDIEDIQISDAAPHIKELARIFGAGTITAYGKFAELWNSINRKRGYGWGVNPWVWAVSFKRVEAA